MASRLGQRSFTTVTEATVSVRVAQISVRTQLHGERTGAFPIEAHHSDVKEYVCRRARPSRESLAPRESMKKCPSGRPHDRDSIFTAGTEQISLTTSVIRQASRLWETLTKQQMEWHQ